MLVEGIKLGYIFPCFDKNGNLKQEPLGLWHNMPGLENKLMTVEDAEKSY